MPLRSQVMFNIGGPADSSPGLVADKAIIAFEHATSTDDEWALDELNGALEDFYNTTLENPHVYLVHEEGRAVGYVVMAEDELMHESYPTELFWDTLVQEGMASQDSNGYHGFTQPGPFRVGTGEGDNFAVVVGTWHKHLDELPVEALSYALKTLFDQTAWPEGAYLFISSARPHNSEKLSGLIIWDATDDFNENYESDDAIFIAVRECNTRQAKRQYSYYAPKEFQE